MSISAYMRQLRALVGHRMLQIPYVAAWITDEGGQLLLVRHVRDQLWGPIGGAVEPEEILQDAVRREVREETHLSVNVGPLHSVHSGPACSLTYPNGDQISAIALVYHCSLTGDYAPRLDLEEVNEIAWFPPAALAELPTKPWLNRLL